MNTEQETQAIEAELDALLATLIKESEAAAGIKAQLQTLDAGTDALESQLTASESDIAQFIEEQSKELDVLINEEQKEMAAEETEPQEE
jgi:myo-inositol-1-phosphate synthase